MGRWWADVVEPAVIVSVVSPSFTDFIDPSAIDAVVFDIGGVFAIRHLDPVRSGMSRAGFHLPDDADLFHEAHHHAVRALTNRLDGEPVREGDRDFWRHFERGYLAHLGVPADRLDEAVEAMWAEMPKESHPVWRRLLEDNIEGFRRIAAAGIPVAIVSNNDGTAEQQMIDFGICQVGDGPLPTVAIVVDSGVVGIAKPDPAIFTPALEALGTDPARTLYVGDTVHADVHGATAAGMPVVQLDPYDLHVDFDHARLPGVSALADLLLATRQG